MPDFMMSWWWMLLMLLALLVLVVLVPLAVVLLLVLAHRKPREAPRPSVRRPVATRVCPTCGRAVNGPSCPDCKVPTVAQAAAPQAAAHLVPGHATEEILDAIEVEERGSRRSPYPPCPRCGAQGSDRITWTFWGSFYGPALLALVRCPRCSCAYSARTGQPNLGGILLFCLLVYGSLLLLVGLLFFFIVQVIVGGSR